MKTARVLSKGLDIFWGTDLGINFTSYDYSLHSPGYIDEDGSIRVTRYVLAPKLGLNVSLSKSFYIMVQARYVLSLGKNDNEASILNKYTSFGTGVAYRF